MKAIRTLTIFLILFVAAPGSGCEKRPIDFRNKYTGHYDLVMVTSWWMMNGDSGETTLNLDGKVTYDKKTRQQIRINYNNTYLNLDIDRDGKLYMCDQRIGEFGKHKKLSITYGSHTCGSGGMGGSSTVTLTGTKK